MDVSGAPMQNGIFQGSNNNCSLFTSSRLFLRRHQLLTEFNNEPGAMKIGEKGIYIDLPSCQATRGKLSSAKLNYCHQTSLKKNVQFHITAMWNMVILLVVL